MTLVKKSNRNFNEFSLEYRAFYTGKVSSFQYLNLITYYSLRITFSDFEELNGLGSRISIKIAINIFI